MQYSALYHFFGLTDIFRVADISHMEWTELRLYESTNK